MWKNTGGYNYPWKLKHVPRESLNRETYNVLHQDTGKQTSHNKGVTSLSFKSFSGSVKNCPQ